MNDSEPLIDVLMATFNGERFVQEMLDSILSQTYRNWRLYIRDDNSSDSTAFILGNFSIRNPGRVIIIPNGGIRLGVVGNFQALMRLSTADYVMFADQDDVWYKDKIKNTFDLVNIQGTKCGPVLVHTDLCVVDNDLRLISSSLARFQGFNPDTGHRPARLIVQNVVTGCTIMMNRELLNLCIPIPNDAIMHDWWIALVASVYGKIYYLNEPTMLYRQHDNNDTGAKKYSFKSSISNGLRIRQIVAQRQSILRTRRQAAAFLREHESNLPTNLKNVFIGYSNLERLTYFSRLACAMKYGFKKHGFLRSFGFYLFL